MNARAARFKTLTTRAPVGDEDIETCCQAAHRAIIPSPHHLITPITRARDNLNLELRGIRHPHILSEPWEEICRLKRDAK